MSLENNIVKIESAILADLEKRLMESKNEKAEAMAQYASLVHDAEYAEYVADSVREMDIPSEPSSFQQFKSKVFEKRDLRGERAKVLVEKDLAPKALEAAGTLLSTAWQRIQYFEDKIMELESMILEEKKVIQQENVMKQEQMQRNKEQMNLQGKNEEAAKQKRSHDALVGLAGFEQFSPSQDYVEDVFSFEFDKKVDFIKAVRTEMYLDGTAKNLPEALHSRFFQLERSFLNGRIETGDIAYATAIVEQQFDFTDTISEDVDDQFDFAENFLLSFEKLTEYYNYNEKAEIESPDLPTFRLFKNRKLAELLMKNYNNILRAILEEAKLMGLDEWDYKKINEIASGSPDQAHHEISEYVDTLHAINFKLGDALKLLEDLKDRFARYL